MDPFFAFLTVTQITEFLQNYGALVAIIISWAGWGFYKWKRNTDWQAKRFMRQVTTTINIFESDSKGNLTLRIRTLDECDIGDIWRNEIAEESILAQAEKTTVEKPFIVLKKKEDMEYILRGIVNKLSTFSASSYVVQSMYSPYLIDCPVKMDDFIVGITCEKYGSTPTQKIRIMLIREKDLDMFCMNPNAEMQFEAPTHKVRMKTLHKMRMLWRKQSKPKFKGAPVLTKMSLCQTI